MIGAIIAATEGAFIMQIVQDYRYAPWLDTLQAVQYSLIFITSWLLFYKHLLSRTKLIIRIGGFWLI